MSKLDDAIKLLNKRFGADYITRGGLTTNFVRHSTGIDALDVAIGGGIPEKKVVMLAGKFSSGKSTAAITTAAQYQKAGKVVLWCDAEGSFDANWAAKFGLDSQKLVLYRPDTVEQVTDAIETLIMTGEIGLVVWDSVAVTPSAKEMESSAEEKSYGGIAKSVGLFMRKITARLSDPRLNLKTSFILINQLRDNLSGMGAKEYTPGGKLLHYGSDIIVWLRPDSEPVGGREAATGITVHLKVVKNRTAPPLRIGSYELNFKGSINNKKSVVELAISLGIIKKGGSVYSYAEGKETVKVKGIDNLVDSLTDKQVSKFKEHILAEVAKGNFDTVPLTEEENTMVEVEVTE